jgi:hypothetical protein
MNYIQQQTAVSKLHCAIEIFQLDQLRRTGGHDVKEMTNNVMSLLMTNNAASYFNLDGRPGIITTIRKRAFSKLSLFKVVEGLQS